LIEWWEKTLFHFFSALGSWVAKKMKVCFVRWQKIELKNLCVGKKKLKTKRCLFVQSGVGCCPCDSKNVRSKHYSFKFAGC
jgi:hypothetical protein